MSEAEEIELKLFFRWAVRMDVTLYFSTQYKQPLMLHKRTALKPKKTANEKSSFTLSCCYNLHWKWQSMHGTMLWKLDQTSSQNTKMCCSLFQNWWSIYYCTFFAYWKARDDTFIALVYSGIAKYIKFVWIVVSFFLL
jgi:hypothetical protein